MFLVGTNIPMTFTDDDLKRFKEWAFNCNTAPTGAKVRALVARLEAAEALEKPLQAFLDFQGERKMNIECFDGLQRTKYLVAKERLETWRKATGK